MALKPTEGLRISVYSWNSDSIIINRGTTPSRQVNLNRKSLSAYWSDPQRIKGHIADFMQDIRNQLEEDQPDIVFFASQNTLERGDYLHSDVIPQWMNQTSYQDLYYVKRTKLILGSYLPISRVALRSSVYATKRISLMIEQDEYADRRRYGDNFQVGYPITDRNGYNTGGAIGTYLRLRGYGLVCLINCQFPTDESNLKEYVQTGNEYIRKSSVFDTDRALNLTIDKLVLEPSRTYGESYLPDYYLVAGTLNYRVTVPNPAANNGVQLFNITRKPYTSYYPMYDELSQSFEANNVTPMMEGIEGRGPEFMPTYKLSTSRKPGDTSRAVYQLGDNQEINPSWTDRILYQILAENKSIEVERYQRYDHGSMVNSTHCGVRAVMTLWVD